MGLLGNLLGKAVKIVKDFTVGLPSSSMATSSSADWLVSDTTLWRHQ
jgi:hypothetical protein